MYVCLLTFGMNGLIYRCLVRYYSTSSSSNSLSSFGISSSLVTCHATKVVAEVKKVVHQEVVAIVMDVIGVLVKLHQKQIIHEILATPHSPSFYRLEKTATIIILW